jgi:hypothetical protein
MRLLAYVSVLMTVAALPVYGDDLEQEQRLQDLAHEAGVETEDLRGAVNTVQADPASYLYSTGELQPPPTPLPAVPAVPSVWTMLAGCESTGNWRANTGNGYYGGLQMDMTFWRSHGGLAYAPRPDLASVSAQVAVAIRGQAVQGWGAWPVCSRRLGLR